MPLVQGLLTAGRVCVSLVGFNKGFCLLDIEGKRYLCHPVMSLGLIQFPKDKSPCQVYKDSMILGPSNALSPGALYRGGSPLCSLSISRKSIVATSN